MVLSVDPRLVNDVSIWIKPLKFELSLALHLATLAVLMRYIPADKRFARWLSIVLAVIAVACFSEIAMITLQSLRGVGSHYGGDLRAPHFFATHLMQGVPLVGWLADRRFGASSVWPRRIVWVTAVAGVVLAVVTFAQALAGQPLI